jgi:chromosome segregation ATPase
MKREIDFVNRDHYGHQSIMTAWAKDDGKPKPLKDGASKEEVKEWTEKMATWALHGSKEMTEIGVLKNKDATLLESRIETSRNFGQMRRAIQNKKEEIASTENEVAELLAKIEESRKFCEVMEKDSKELNTKRIRIDHDRSEIKKKLRDLQSVMESLPE